MKKLTMVLVLIVPILLSGCSVQRKSSSTATTTDTSIAAQTPPPEISSTAIASDSTSPTASSSDIDSAYQKNYQAALADANATLQNKAKLCSVMIKFAGSTVSTAGDQLFFFYSDELSADYYWVVEFDGLSSNKKRRLFVARRDFKDEIKCFTTVPSTPPSFADAFTSYLKQYQVPSTTAFLQMSAQDSAWDIIARDATGAITSNGQISISSQQATVVVTPTSTTAAGTN